MTDGAVNPAESSGALPTVLVIGPVPPPAFGVAKATELMVHSPVLATRLRLLHLDTSDTRGLANMGRLDSGNVCLGLTHLRRLTRLLAKERPRVVLLTASQGRLALVRDRLFVLLGRAFGGRIVTYLRGSRYAEMRTRQGWVAARLLRSILKASFRVIVLGESLVHMAQKVHPGVRVAVIPNGCPPAVPPDKTGVRDEEHPVLLYMGRLSRAKGLEDALHAAQGITASHSEAEFVFCGEWDSVAYQAKIMRQVEEEALSGVVRFPGPVTGPDKEALFARAWVLVVPSHSEGQPWVILEAMSAGVPVVATDTGAIAETLVDGLSGYVVPVGNSELLTQRLRALLQDDVLWKQMSNESLRRYHERFTVEKNHGLLAEELCRVVHGE